MMLFIENNRIDLPDDFQLVRTLQVNKINDISSRQSNHSFTINLPKTSRNTIAFSHLWEIGNRSPYPYKVNQAVLFDDSGRSLIKNGTVVFLETTETDYKIALYDGYISFSKKIENRSITETDLTSLNHTINPQKVRDSWLLDLNYRYLIADYNGNVFFEKEPTPVQQTVFTSGLKFAFTESSTRRFLIIANSDNVTSPIDLRSFFEPNKNCNVDAMYWRNPPGSNNTRVIDVAGSYLVRSSFSNQVVVEIPFNAVNPDVRRDATCNNSPWSYYLRYNEVVGQWYEQFDANNCGDPRDTSNGTRSRYSFTSNITQPQDTVIGLNIDYIVPSIKIAYLWQKIHEFAGFTYTGSIFEKSDFTSRYITYPKAIGSQGQELLPVFSKQWISNVVYTSNNPNDVRFFRSLSLTTSLSSTPDFFENQYIKGSSFLSGGSYVVNQHFEVKQEGNYKITISGVVNNSDRSQNLIVIGTRPVGSPPLTLFSTEPFFQADTGVSFNVSKNVQLSQSSEFQLSFSVGSDPQAIGDINVSIELVSGQLVDVQEALIDLKMTDFVKQIMQLYGLTPFLNPDTNEIKYLTYAEWFGANRVLDWSMGKNRFSRKLSEKYQLGNYGQRNFFRYTYNDSAFDHNDGYISILDGTLPDSVEVIKSIFYSPEPERSLFLDSEIYKIWDKEPNEDGSIKYKELKNRFYIIDQKRVSDGITLISEKTGSSTNAAFYYKATFDELRFNKIIDRYYAPMTSLLNRSRMIDAEVYLDERAIIDFSFENLVYIQEESSYFLVDSLPKIAGPGIYTIPLVEVDYCNDPPLPPEGEIQPPEES